MSEIKTCDCNIIHKDIIESAKEKMPEMEKLYELADFFKIFGDSTRIGILQALEISEMCVCDISSLLNMTSSAISHQLRTLKQANLVKYRKEGKVVYYSLADEHINQIFKSGFEHILEK